jgi:hypothetical protein
MAPGCYNEGMELSEPVSGELRDVQLSTVHELVARQARGGGQADVRGS